MRRRQQFYSVTIGFIILSLAALLLFRTPVGTFVQGVTELVMRPLQRVFYGTPFGVLASTESDEIKRLKEENHRLMQKFVGEKEMERENQALKDQFATADIPTKQLIPATIIGRGDSILSGKPPRMLVIDKGTADNVTNGAVLIYKNILIGKVVKASLHVSLVATVMNQQIALTGQTIETGALGLVRGQNDVVLFTGVVLSDTLQVGDIIQTKGDVDEKGQGYMNGLLVGKITAVSKVASALFQTAEVAPLLDMSRLSTVFVYNNPK